MKPSAHILFLFLILSSACAVYSNSFRGDFQFDDEDSISENAAVKRPPSLSNLSEFSLSGGRALIVETFRINYYIGKLDVLGYHIFNLAVHLLNIIAVYMLALKIFGNGRHAQSMSGSGYPAAVAAVFALHPLQTESVTYIVQRAEAVSSFFYVVGLYCLVSFAEGGRRRLFWWLAGFSCLVLGWYSKEIIISMPIVFLLYALFFADTSSLKRAFSGVAPLVAAGAAAAAAVLVRLGNHADVGFSMKDIDSLTYLLTQTRVLFTYLRLFFLPVNQTLDYDYPLFHYEAVWLLVLWAAVVAASFMSLVVRGRMAFNARLLGFGMLWFLTILAPTSGLVPIRDVIFEHRMYLPLAGLAMSSVAATDMLRMKLADVFGPAGIRVIFVAVFLSVCLLLALAAHERNNAWSTKLSLWSDAAKKAPLKSRPWNNLGNCYYLRGEYAVAAAHYRTAIKNDPRNVEAWYNAGQALEAAGAGREAAYYYSMFVRLVPDKNSAIVKGVISRLEGMR